MNIALALTSLRLLLVPVLVLAFYLPFPGNHFAAAVIFTIASITDWLDGYLARKNNEITEFGTFLDPISDKIFVATIMLMLVATDRVDGAWVVLVIFILVREFTVSGLREFLGPKGIKVPVSALAKWKTAVQMIATGLLIIGPYIYGGILLGLFGLLAATVITVYTGWEYLKVGFEHMKDDV